MERVCMCIICLNTPALGILPTIYIYVSYDFEK
jgi:hypothetical protein